MDQLIEFSSNHWELMVALAVTLAMLLHTYIAPHLRKYKELTPQEVTQLMNQQDALVLDIRETHEYNGGHILDSVHIPQSAVEKRLGEIEAYRERPVIVNCKTGTRATGVCGKLVKNGFAEVYNLKGGMAEWENSSLPVSKSSRKGKSKRKK